MYFQRLPLVGFLTTALGLSWNTSSSSASSPTITSPTPNECPTGPALPTNPHLSNGLALTPPMGWSSWNQFGDQIDEILIRDTIQTMASNGLKDAGYVFVNLDDGWQRYKGNRSANPLEADPVKFPSGIKALADFAHAHGFKLGIYSGPGQSTCAGYTGSEGHEDEDAAMFASWGIDHLKYDSCCSHEHAPKSEVQKIVLKMSKALLAQSHPIVYHACHCGWADIWEWAADEGANQWRIGQDISDEFNYPGNREKYYFDVLDMLDRGNELVKYSGPGHWNDYDMLIVGLNGNSSQLVGTGASNIEYRTHFSMWAMVASPLLIGSDVRTLDTYSLQTLTNKEVIEVSQDPLGNAAETVGVGEEAGGDLQVYAKEMLDGSYAVALLNRGSFTAEMSISPRRDLTMPWDQYRLRDLWKHKEGTYDVPYTTEVMPHEAKVLRLWQVQANASMCFFQ
ncbi:Alpha-galactosidase [Venustampulla echinocandica]|uniref:Alpha-galactosidase n=1 Tax=Venustampulla echinocandica TaxID=2656787 RepID=A0A370T8Y5_9HELO|nr:Alpha-galactosidase [Venustampulla echinocandica]RDL29946.1 Alpha-galactosidase [Venustampulla echinocandica]